MPESLQVYLQERYQAALADPADYAKQTELARAYATHQLWDSAITGFRSATEIDPEQPQPCSSEAQLNGQPNCTNRWQQNFLGTRPIWIDWAACV